MLIKAENEDIISITSSGHFVAEDGQNFPFIETRTGTLETVTIDGVKEGYVSVKGKGGRET